MRVKHVNARAVSSPPGNNVTVFDRRTRDHPEGVITPPPPSRIQRPDERAYVVRSRTPRPLRPSRTTQRVQQKKNREIPRPSENPYRTTTTKSRILTRHRL